MQENNFESIENLSPENYPTILPLLRQEFELGSTRLLNHLSQQRRFKDVILEFLGQLTVEQVQTLLDMEELKRNPDLLEKIIIFLPISINLPDVNESISRNRERQIEILNHLFSSETVGKGSLSYIKYLKNHEADEEGIFTEEMKTKAREGWEQLYEKAITDRNCSILKAFLVDDNGERIATHLRDLYTRYHDSEDEEAKKTLKEEINAYLSIFTHDEVPANWFWIQQLYDQAYFAQDLKFCRLFLPIFSRSTLDYHLLPRVTHLVTLPEKKALCINVVSTLLSGGEEDKALCQIILNKVRGGEGTFMDGGRLDITTKLEALSNLVVHFEGFDKAVNPACDELFEFAKKELEKIIEPLLDNFLGQDVTSSKHVTVSEITGDLIKDLGNYFAQMPDDPQEAFEAYQTIIETARQAVEDRLDASEFDLVSFLLNALCVLLTGGLALIPILVNKANHKPDFFSHVTEMPKAYLNDTLNKLTTAGAANGFFSRRRSEEDAGSAVDEEKKLLGSRK